MGAGWEIRQRKAVLVPGDRPDVARIKTAKMIKDCRLVVDKQGVPFETQPAAALVKIPVGDVTSIITQNTNIVIHAGAKLTQFWSTCIPIAGFK